MITYKPLLKKMIDLGWEKKDLKEKAGISWATVTKIGKDEPISLKMIDKICSATGLQPGQIMKHIED
ncbi:helix-turn-helix domain-containing protein [Orenia marismortui]|uniref:helix-turn-helix domain-containing protein n=1 Tax=Orenia marismortui TaxID=46469 RepID=UPI000366734F|nr:helix-turn-helix transcriptional regulator [Orenia marismortui]